MQFSVKYLPITIVVLLVVTVSVTLYLTYKQDHVSHSVPYISDTGTIPPESCIFGQSLNILWIIVSFAMYIKYRQTRSILNKNNMERYQLLNKRTLEVGLLTAFGISVVANFQETNSFFVHWTGAVLVFGGGSIYQCLQTLLYVRLFPAIGQRKLTRLRMALATQSTISFLIFFVCAMISYIQKKISGDYLHWKKEDGGFENHNVSVISEWICATSTVAYLTLFSAEFKKITVHEPGIVIEEENDAVEEIDSIRVEK